MLKLCLLGPTGQLGTDLRRAAETRGRSIELRTINRAELNVADPEAIGPVLAGYDFDALINCTGYHRTDEVESNGSRAVTINAHAVRAMAEHCAERSARFVHISTDYVFDGRADRPYTEDDPSGPLNVYGATKLMGEALARTVHDDTLIFRVASLFGVAGASGKGGNFVETMIRVGRERGALRVIDDQFMSPTAAADAAELILRALEHRVPAGIYHAVNSGSASWHTFASRIIERAGVDATVEPISAAEWSAAARRPGFSVLDNGKLAEQLGPIPHWEDALDRYLRAKGHLAPSVAG